MKLILTTILFSYFIALTACTPKAMEEIKPDAKITMSPGGISYLALGDSYTIGESVPQTGSFPYQLGDSLYSRGTPLSRIKVVARTGWTTDELMNAIKAENITDKFNIVTLLIGVNNQYRGYSADTYRKEFKDLLNLAITFAGGNNGHVYVLSIPDWGKTPFAEGRDRNAIAAEIDLFNSINKEETLRMNVAYVDITPISRQAPADRALIASDGLHPSAKMYTQWVQQLLPKVKIQ